MRLCAMVMARPFILPMILTVVVFATVTSGHLEYFKDLPDQEASLDDLAGQGDYSEDSPDGGAPSQDIQGEGDSSEYSPSQSNSPERSARETDVGDSFQDPKMGTPKAAAPKNNETLSKPKKPTDPTTNGTLPKIRPQTASKNTSALPTTKKTTASTWPSSKPTTNKQPTAGPTTANKGNTKPTESKRSLPAWSFIVLAVVSVLLIIVIVTGIVYSCRERCYRKKNPEYQPVLTDAESGKEN